MKKSLLAIALAAATLPLTFAQTPAPASQPDQKSTATTKKATKSKHHAKKTSATKSTTSNPSK
jgi:hypothetical protein